MPHPGTGVDSDRSGEVSDKEQGDDREDASPQMSSKMPGVEEGHEGNADHHDQEAVGQVRADVGSSKHQSKEDSGERKRGPRCRHSMPLARTVVRYAHAQHPLEQTERSEPVIRRRRSVFLRRELWTARSAMLARS